MIVLLATLSSYAQDSVKYSPDFKFADGIYLTVDDFKNNSPIPITHVISFYDIRDPDYLLQVMQHTKITYYDQNLNETSVKRKSIWGLSMKGVPFVQAKRGSFDKIEIVGRICHVLTVGQGLYALGMYALHGSNAANMPTGEIKERLIDLETGEVLKFNDANIARLIEPEKDLYLRFSNLNEAQRYTQRYDFVKEFNKMRPIYFPISD